MAKKKNFKVLVYFQGIHREDGQDFDLTTVLDQIMGLDLVDRNVEVGDDLVRIEQAFDDGTCKVYDLAKLRMNDVAETGRTAALSLELPLKDDEGLSEHTLFAVPSGTNIVAVCRTQYGLRAEGIAAYISNFMAGNPPLETSVVQTSDPMKRADKIDRVKKLVFKVQRSALQASRTTGMRKVLDRIDGLTTFGGETIDVAIGLGYKRNGELDPVVALEVVKGLHLSDAVDKLCLTGIRQDGERDEIDFMTNRLTEKIVITPTASRRGLTVRDRGNAVSRAIRKHREYLRVYEKVDVVESN